MEVYYFSGTGNSLSVAKTIAVKSNSEVIRIGNKKIEVKDQKICIVFPSYIAASVGMPLSVDKFVRNIKDIEAKEFHIVCTCGGYEIMNALPSLHKLKHIIHVMGGKVIGSYSLRMPMNNLNYDHIPIPISKDIEKINKNALVKSEKIATMIINNSKTRFSFLKELFYYSMVPLFMLISIYIKHEMKTQAKENNTKKTVRELVSYTDRSIIVEDACKGCGICATVCPVENIVIVDRKPVFQHQCDMCFACDEWCPSNSIHHWGRNKDIKYRHPEVKRKDFINKV